MRPGRGGSINNLYPDSLSCEIAIVFLHIFIMSSLEPSVSACSGLLVSRPEDSKREPYKNAKRFLIRSLKGKAMCNCHW